MKRKDTRVPGEDREQQTLFQWTAIQSNRWPELDLLYHIPNGGKRDKITAARLKGQGVKAGVPDLCLPVARNGFHGLYIELKRTKGGRTTDCQKQWLNALSSQGYCTAVCSGWAEASQLIIRYLSGKIQTQGGGLSRIWKKEAGI